MDELLQDASRLNTILNLSVGQESFSPTVYFKDFTRYFFTRFVSNLKHTFSNFSQSEIENFNKRHQDKLAVVFKYPELKHKKQIVQIPKGMILTYRSTLDQLQDVLKTICAEKVFTDIEALNNALVTNSTSKLSLMEFGKTEFDKTKLVLSKLFGKVGLDHATADHALVKPQDMSYVNTQLLSITRQYYPELLNLDHSVQRLEKTLSKTKISEGTKAVVAQALMSLAYRLSIMAVTMDKIQELEHGFVMSVGYLIKND